MYISDNPNQPKDNLSLDSQDIRRMMENNESKKKNRIEDEDDEDDDEENIQKQEAEEKDEEGEDLTFGQKIAKFSLKFIANTVFYIEFFLLPFVMVFLSICIPFMGLTIPKYQQILIALWVLACNLSIIYTQLNLFYYKVENDNLRYIFIDGMFFYINAILVFSYIKAHCQNVGSISQIFGNIFSKRSFATFQYLTEKKDDSMAFLFDYGQLNESKSIKDNGISNLSQRYNLFSFVNFNRTNLQHNIFDLNEKTQYLEYLTPEFNRYFILIGVVSIKIYLTFQYLFLQETQFSHQIWIDLVVNIFLYFYTTFNLNRILGNYDLRKKCEALDQLNNLVNFRDLTKKNIKQAEEKIDFTCPVSMESWDNYRKVILSNQNKEMQNLELSYFCLFFYFIFVTLIVFSSFFELYWIFPKESILLSPIYVIMSSFDFVFLSLFLLFRFYYGNQFNDMFEEMDLNLSSLLDVVEDLQTMYDYYFDCKLKDVPSEDLNSRYGLVIQKIKILSKQYIKNREQVDGVIYENTLEQKGKLRRKLLEMTKKSVKKIKKSVESDSKEYRYLFLNLVEVNFQDTFTSLVIALVTTLPTIVPKFIEFYTKNTGQEGPATL